MPQPSAFLEAKQMTVSEQEVFLFGASGHAKVVIDIVERAKRYRILGLFDDAPPQGTTVFFGYGLLGNRDELIRRLTSWTTRVRGLVTIGDNVARCSVATWLQSQGIQLGEAVHPSAQIARDVTIGTGTVVMAHSTVNPTTFIGECTIINTGASVDHDCRIGRFVHIAPGARLCGGVHVGDRSLIGAGAVIIPGIRVGSNAVVGAGSTVIRDVPDDAKIVGCPAHRIETRQ